MSVEPLLKVTLCGPLSEKRWLLEGLQQLGCLHLVPLDEAERDYVPAMAREAEDALRFLRAVEGAGRRQVHDGERFDPDAVVRRAREIERRLDELEAERDALLARLAELAPWGDFELPPLGELGGDRLWFYPVPHYRLRRLQATPLRWNVVARDDRFAYVVVLSPEEPSGVPAERSHTGARRLSEVRRRLEAVEVETDDLQAERLSLSRWCDLLRRALDHLHDRAALAEAEDLTLDAEPVFALRAWAPRRRAGDLEAFARARGVALELAPPADHEHPPTSFENRPSLRAGEDLVGFYMTPSYWSADPSPVVFVSFALFFAIVLSDAGYAALLGLALLLAWRWLGRRTQGRRLRPLLLALTLSSIGWGALCGSYFGVSPPSGSRLHALQVLDLHDMPTLMGVTLLIGVAHVVAGNLANAWSRGRDRRALVPGGWALAVTGAASLWLGTTLELQPARVAGWAGMSVGALAVLAFANPSGSFWARLGSGLLELTKVNRAFGDVLSYLRLFALGLASASLAIAFNGLARQAADAVPGFGTLLALVVLVVGHGLNLLLGVVGGFVHGLRLNFIEYFNWSVDAEGTPFRAFARRESAWTS